MMQYNRTAAAAAAWDWVGGTRQDTVQQTLASLKMFESHFIFFLRLCEKYVHPVQISVQQFGNAVEKV